MAHHRRMTRRTLSTAADVTAGSFLLLLTLMFVIGESGPTGLKDALGFLIKVTMPITGLLLIVRGVAGSSE